VLFAGPAVAQGIAGNPENGQALYAPCVACHGANGEGNQALHAPRLAGQYGWYLKRQLEHFKSGVRGAHVDDVYGQQMAPMASVLPDDQAVKDVVAFIAQLESAAPAPTVQGGNAEQGKAHYMTCAACHGAGGEGNEALNAPRLAGQHDWYLIRQLANFKASVRGAHADDVYGQQMAPMASVLSDDQAVKDVVAFIQSLK
jgi:cytochrome c oxidase subunit 2